LEEVDEADSYRFGERWQLIGTRVEAGEMVIELLEAA